MNNPFYTGLKLKAADLNNAINSIAGLDMPAKNIKMKSTDKGRLFTNYEVFTNREESIPNVLDVGYTVELADTVQNCKRRVFLSLPKERSLHQSETVSPFPTYGFNDLGHYNMAAYRAIFGMLTISSGTSLSYYKAGRTTTESEMKLYTDKASRKADILGYWYTGLCPENDAETTDKFDIYSAAIMLTCKKGGQSFYFTGAIVFFEKDIDNLTALVESNKSTMISYMNADSDFTTDGYTVDNVHLATNTNYVLIAKYVKQEDYFQTQWVQQASQIDITSGFEPWEIHTCTFSGNSINFGAFRPEYININGETKLLDDQNSLIKTLEFDGAPNTTNYIAILMECDISNIEVPTYKVIAKNCDFKDAFNMNTFIDTFKQVNHEYRLIAIYGTSLGFMYFDRKPTFTSTIIYDKEISALQHKSLERVKKVNGGKDVYVSLLFEFNNLSNSYLGMQFINPKDPDFDDNADMVIRLVDRETNDVNIAYVSLSSLSGLISGDISCNLSVDISCVGDTRYDLDSHQLQQRIDLYNVLTGQVTIGQYAMIVGGQAIAHSTL